LSLSPLNNISTLPLGSTLLLARYINYCRQILDRLLGHLSQGETSVSIINALNALKLLEMRHWHVLAGGNDTQEGKGNDKSTQDS